MDPASKTPKEIWALCRVARPDLCFIRYTLEAYEGLCVPTSLPGGEGLLRLSTSADLRAELQAALRALAAEVPMVVESWGEQES